MTDDRQAGLLREALDKLERDVSRALSNGPPVIDPMASYVRRDLTTQFAAVRAALAVAQVPAQGPVGPESASYWKALWETAMSTIDRQERALAALPAQEEQLDVERVWQAMTTVDESGKANSRRHWRELVAAEYARLSEHPAREEGWNE